MWGFSSKKKKEEMLEKEIQFCLHCIKQIEQNFDLQTRIQMLKSITKKVRVFRDMIRSAQIDDGAFMKELLPSMFRSSEESLELAAKNLEKSRGGLDRGWHDRLFCEAFIWKSFLTIFVTQVDSNSLAMVIYTLSKVAFKDYGDRELQECAVEIGKSGAVWKS